jgi:ABC-type lipoprotein release transport system permease subunit
MLEEPGRDTGPMIWLIGLIGALVGVGAGILLALLVRPVDPTLSGIAGVVIGAGVAAAAAE